MGSSVCKNYKSKTGREQKSEAGREEGKEGLTCGTAPSDLWWSFILWASKYSWNGFWREGPILGIALMESSSQRARQNRGGKKNKKQKTFFFKLTTLPNQNKVQAEPQLSRELEATRENRNKPHFIFRSDTSGGMHFPRSSKSASKEKYFWASQRWEERREPEQFLGGSSAENPMNDFGEVPHLSAAVPVRTGLNRLMRKWLGLVSSLG